MDEGKNGSCEWSQMAGAQSSTEQQRTFSTSTKVHISYLGCALFFASEAKIGIEAKIEIEAESSFRLEAKKGLLSLVSHMTRISKNLKRK
jgi:hypothetical protein